jgi:hypothetical protein
MSAYPSTLCSLAQRRGNGRAGAQATDAVHQYLSLSVRRPGECVSIRRCATSVDRPTDASVMAEQGTGAFWTASVVRQN